MRSLLIFFLVIMAISTASLARDGEFDTRNPEEAKKDKLNNPPKDIPEKAGKMIAVLKTLNLDHPYLTDTIIYIDENRRGDFIYLMDEEIIDSGIQMQVRYGPEYIYADGKSRKNVQLNFTAEDSNYNLSGSSEGVMLRYRIEF